MKHNPSVSHHAPSLKSWVVWGLSCVFYFYECLLQVSPSVMSSELMRDFAMTSHSLGILIGFYFYSYAIMQLPCGMLMDYFGPRRLLTLAAVLCAISSIAFGLTTSFTMACIARFMIGLGSAFAAVGAMKLSVSWFPAQRFALLTGMMVTIGMLGAIFGEAPLALLIDHCGWRDSMFVMGAIGLFIALLIFTVITDSPSKPALFAPADPVPHREPVFSSLFAILKNHQIWLVALYGGLVYMVTPIFCGLWGVPFLMFKMHIAKATAANYISLVFVGWAIASPFWGSFSNRIGRRKTPMYMGCSVAFVLCCLFVYAPLHAGWLIQLILLCFGVFSAGFLPAFAMIKELCNKNYVATGLSFMNMMNMIGIALAQPVIGYILDLLWQGQSQHHVRMYSLDAYMSALTLLPVGMFIALLLLPFIKETYCKNIN